MKYVFDSSPFIDMRNYYPAVFKSFWISIDKLIFNGDLVSVKEVYNELLYGSDMISKWAKSHQAIFLEPVKEEYEILGQILAHHKELIRSRNINEGRPVADPFVIAKAYPHKLTVVTHESFKEHSHSIPNVCKELDLPCINFEELMIKEGWSF